MSATKSIKYGFAVVTFIAVFAMFHNNGNSVTIVPGERAKGRLLSSSSSAHRSLKVIGKNSKSDDAPLVLWLMSFPESGGSFTINTVEKSSGFGTATNYGNIFMNSANEEYVMDTYVSVPIYYDRPNGPFFYSDRAIPSPWMLTKTHCGGHCTDCAVEDFVISTDDFYMQCAQGRAFYPANGDISGGQTRRTQYSPRLAKRAVHLVRNPFDNIASRFHREYRRHTTKGNFEFTKTFPYNQDGFHAWCQYLSDQVDPKQIALKHTSSGNLKDKDYFFATAQEEVPCFTEFYKYIQWHNHAARILTNYNGDVGNLPHLVLHYEDYLHNFDGAVDAVLKFSKLPRVSNTKRLFFERYDYFTQEQMENIKDFMRALVNEEASSVLEPYLGAIETDAK